MRNNCVVAYNYYNRMFSKLATRAQQAQHLTALSSQAFRATTVANASKKPSIGDAVTILQSKVSQINQVVSCKSAPPPAAAANTRR